MGKLTISKKFSLPKSYLIELSITLLIYSWIKSSRKPLHRIISMRHFHKRHENPVSPICEHTIAVLSSQNSIDFIPNNTPDSIHIDFNYISLIKSPALPQILRFLVAIVPWIAHCIAWLKRGSWSFLSCVVDDTDYGVSELWLNYSHLETCLFILSDGLVEDILGPFVVTSHVLYYGVLNMEAVPIGLSDCVKERLV